MDKMLQAVDEALTRFLAQWDIYSTIIVSVITLVFAYSVFTRQDPDTHPMLLARQSQPSNIRHEGQSPIYRSHAAPHGMDLNAGLNVKDPGASKWARGRNGDLRDIWRRAISGAVDKEGVSTGCRGRIITISGTKEHKEHDLDDLSRQINAIGRLLLHDHKRRIALCLPNSIELLLTIFACSFYDMTPILLPYNQSPDTMVAMLKAAEADALVAAAGSISIDLLGRHCPALKQLIWVTDPGSQHMDWNELPKGSASDLNIFTWQDVAKNDENSTLELPALTDVEAKGLITFWQSTPEELGRMVEYSQGNLVAGIAAQLAAIPTARKLGSSDLVLAVDSLSTIYTLSIVLGALYSGCSLALNSVAGPQVDLVLATQGVAPTVIVASPATLLKAHQEATKKLSSQILKILHWIQTRTLTQDGVMPAASYLKSFSDTVRPVIGTTPGKLRLIYSADRGSAASPPLSAFALSDLRIFTGARIIYALTAPDVAGAVAQTAFYDYRVDGEVGERSHFGAPLSSVEIFFSDTADLKTTNNISAGQIVARGPAVVKGEAALGVLGRMRDDLTIAYA